MYLKKLEILGFKSFADKIKMDFQPGITAIVGPNGCGKSNVADAFRWVLGEQSAKSMRGSRMPDVIFAGTIERKALNFAEVTITLSEVQLQLPVPYEELSVTRRLHRNGESEYFINRQPARLKDIQGLFLDSGMGKDAYSIFEQGKIDQVINLPPLERRYIFEEAAGILRFLQRKKETLKKLEHSEYNIARIKDIYQEVERQITLLDEQAEKARGYKENIQKLEHLEKMILLVKWEALNSVCKITTAKKEEMEVLLLAETKQLETHQVHMSEAKQMLEETEQLWRKREELVYQLKSSGEVSFKEKTHCEKRLREIQSNEERWKQELTHLSQKRKQRHEERQETNQRKISLEIQLKECVALSSTQREKGGALDKAFSTEREEQQFKQKELLKLMQRENQFESEVRQLVIRIEALQERQQQIHMRTNTLKSSLEGVSLQHVNSQAALEISIQNIAVEKQKFSEMEQSLVEINKEMSKLQQEQERKHLEITDSKARHKVLQALHDGMEGFSSGSKRLLQEAASPSSPFFKKLKPLYEFFIPERDFEEPLSAVMKPYMQTLVVAESKDFDTLLDYIRLHGLKDVSLICQEAILSSSQANQMPKLSSEQIPLIEYVQGNSFSTHFLRDVYVGSSKDFVATSSVDLWLKEGILIDKKNVFFIVSKGEGNVFLREADLKLLGEKLLILEREKGELDQVVQAKQQKRSQVQLDRIELDKQIRRMEIKQMEMQFECQKIMAECDKMSKEQKLLEKEQMHADETLQQYRATLVEFKQKHQEARNFTSSLQEALEAGHEKLNALAFSAKQEAHTLRSQESEMHKLTEEMQKMMHALHIMEIRDLESIQQEKQLSEEIERGKSERSQIQVKGNEVEKLLEEAEQRLMSAASVCKDLEHQTAVRKKSLSHFESQIQERRHGMKKLEVEKHRIMIQLTQQEATMHALVQELKERYQLGLEQLREKRSIDEKIGLEQAEKQVKNLRHLIESAGSVNMMAIEECEKHRERYQFLNRQMADLQSSKEELVSLIAELDKESRKIFKESFNLIRANFQKNFKILFSGGEADLQFSDGSDLLEAGIEIIAQPPGKQMRSINLLSGGEKCLTAMALLFAIFEVKPSPFCVLDEIDAPLDDSNVERFVNIVKLFVDRCQFIIITHNKRTMAIADKLFGVSMETKGVSKLLSIDFSKDQQPQLISQD